MDFIKPGAFKKYRGIRNPNMIVTHWDVCTSAEKCKRVLEARGISTHFCIDNDGTIYQYLDTNDVGWHAGKVNNYSIGIDFSNAYYVRYNSLYELKGFKPRPVLENSRVHGVKLKPHLGYYPVQIEAYKRLIKTISRHYNIPLVVPTTDDEKLMTGVCNSAASGKFKGIVCHYHLTRKKIDCAGLELKKIIDSLY
jgi:N-acetyl-anhydromuramyl-L-alanine amidase AmpD